MRCELCGKEGADRRLVFRNTPVHQTCAVMTGYSFSEMKSLKEEPTPVEDGNPDDKQGE